jgi:hypothetical protein
VDRGADKANPSNEGNTEVSTEKAAAEAEEIAPQFSRERRERRRPMTIETRATIRPDDILAVEYECPKCHAKSVRPITHPIKNDGRSNVIPHQCGNCTAAWIADGSRTAEDLTTLLNLIAIFREGDGSLPFVMRFEISGLDQVALREKQPR